jgi:hypothetical protein
VFSVDKDTELEPIKLFDLKKRAAAQKKGDAVYP